MLPNIQKSWVRLPEFIGLGWFFNNLFGVLLVWFLSFTLLGNALIFFCLGIRTGNMIFFMKVNSLLISINLGSRSLKKASNIMRLIIKLQELAIFLSKKWIKIPYFARTIVICLQFISSLLTFTVMSEVWKHLFLFLTYNLLVSLLTMLSGSSGKVLHINLSLSHSFEIDLFIFCIHW